MKRTLAIAALLVTTRARAAVDVDPASTACTVKGKTSIATQLYAGPVGGTPLVTLSAHERIVEALELPADTQSGRVHVRARRDVPGLRVDGYIAGKVLTFSASKDQVVVTDHVWIRGGAALKLFQGASDLEGEPLNAPIAHARTRIACGELRFGTFSASATSKASDWYFFRQKSTPLFDAPGGKVIFTVTLNVGTHGVSVGSVKKQGAFHEIVVDDAVRLAGWVRAADLEPDKEDYGAVGGLGLSGTGTSGSSMPIRTAKQDVEVYLGPSSTGPAVGVLEKGAKVYATPVANGFSTITFVDRDAVAPDGKQLHVLTTAVQ